MAYTAPQLLGASSPYQVKFQQELTPEQIAYGERMNQFISEGKTPFGHEQIPVFSKPLTPENADSIYNSILGLSDTYASKWDTRINDPISEGNNSNLESLMNSGLPTLNNTDTVEKLAAAKDYLVGLGYDKKSMDTAFSSLFHQTLPTLAAKYFENTNPTGWFEDYVGPAIGVISQIGMAVGLAAISGGALAPALGTTGGAIAGGAISGAASGAMNNTEDRGKGALVGGLTGAVAGGVSSAVSPYTSSLAGGLSSAGMSDTAANLAANTLMGGATGATTGAASSALQGTDVGEGAYTGAVGGALNAATKSANPVVSSALQETGMNQTAADTLAGGLTKGGASAIMSEVKGKDSDQTALSGLTGLASGALSGAGSNSATTTSTNTKASDVLGGDTMADEFTLSDIPDYSTALDYNPDISQSDGYTVGDGFDLGGDYTGDINYGAGGSGGGSSIDWTKIGSTALSALGGLGGAYLSTKAQTDAANSATNAQNNATNLQRSIYDKTEKNFEPYRLFGAKGLDEMSGLLYGKGYDIAESPSAQYALTKGSRELNRQLAARGNLGGGTAAQRLSELSSGIAASDYMNRYNMLQNAIQTGSGATAQTGQAGTTLGNQAQTGAANLGTIAKDEGGAKASLYSGLGPAISNTASTLLKAYQ